MSPGNLHSETQSGHVFVTPKGSKDAPNAIQVSLCMIVRNEAELLPEFLKAADGVWDELCVVDTGSEDPSIAILQAAGARVQSMVWQDDFSLARNASLSMAQGEWVLILDPDERVAPAFAAELRAFCAQAGHGAATIEMHNPMPNGHRRESRLLRLFRRDESIRFRYPIHEDASADIRDFLSLHRLQMGHLETPVTHLGYVRAHAAAKNKYARDRQILEAQLARAPDDVYSRFKLLESARFWNDVASWQVQARIALQGLEHDPGALPRDFRYGGDYMELIAEGLYGDSPQEAYDLCRRYEDRLMPSAELFFGQGLRCERLGLLPTAADYYRRCIGMPGVQNSQMSSVRPRLGLCRLALMQGDLAAAKQHDAEALADNPVDPEGLLIAIMLARVEGGESGVEDFCAGHRAQHGERPELHIALGEEHFLAGRYGRACDCLALGVAAAPEDRSALRWAQALIADDRLEQAHSVLAERMSLFPEAGLGVLVCELALGKPSDLQLDIEPEDTEGLMKPWIDALFASGDRSALGCFLQNSRLVYEVFPWLEGYLKTCQTRHQGGGDALR